MSLPSATETLPRAAIDELFARLATRYGHRFMSLYDGLHIDDVKNDWCAVLARLTPAHFDHAMSNLPAGRPPDAGEFRNLCLSKPRAPMAFSRRIEQQASPQTLAALAPVIERLKKPLVHDEPQKVRWARNYVAEFGSRPKQELMAVQRDTLVHARRILERHEGDVSTDARKAEAQAKVEERQQQEQGDA